MADKNMSDDKLNAIMNGDDLSDEIARKIICGMVLNNLDDDDDDDDDGDEYTLDDLFTIMLNMSKDDISAINNSDKNKKNALIRAHLKSFTEKKSKSSSSLDAGAGRHQGRSHAKRRRHGRRSRR